MSLNIISWNILHHLPNRKPPIKTEWGARKAKMFSMIAHVLNPDIIGFQEPSLVQRNEFIHPLSGSLAPVRFSSMPEASRNVGNKGCTTTIFYRPSRVTLLSAYNYYIKHVDVPRVTTAATFRCNTTGKEFQFVNTHFEKRKTTRNSTSARVQSAQIIATHRRTNNNIPTIVTGDFNCSPGGKAVLEMKKNFHCARDVAKKYVGAGKKVATHLGNNCLTVGKEKKETIDYIFCSKGQFVVDKYAVRVKANLRNSKKYLSDHRPVQAIVRLL